MLRALGVLAPRLRGCLRARAFVRTPLGWIHLLSASGDFAIWVCGSRFIWLPSLPLMIRAPLSCYSFLEPETLNPTSKDRLFWQVFRISPNI